MANEFKGIVGTPVTPFTPENRIDFPTFEKQIDWLIRMGVDAVAHPMNIGEAPNLSLEERRQCVERLVKAAAGRVPVLIHVSMAGTDQVRDLALSSQKAGAAGVVVMPPYHWQPPRPAIMAHFRSIAAALDIAFVAYNNIKAVGVEIAPDMVAELIEAAPNFVGLKDASYHMRYFCEVCTIASTMRPGFGVFVGTEYLLPAMALGGAGAFSACGEVAPRLLRDLYEACAKGEMERARTLQHRVGRLLKVLMTNYPATIKYAMELLGRPVGQTRLPILPLTEEAKAKAKKDLENLGIFEREPSGWA
jgi:4-hydroxy-tetrahydrodipicolinate synthase